MKLCFVSTSFQESTGYSKVAYNLLRELKDMPIELFHYATESKGKLEYRPALSNITVKYVNDYGLEGVQEFCEENRIDVVMIYADIGVVLSYLQKWCPPRLWVYLDTVAHGIPAPLLKILDEKAERIFLMNSYWKKVYNFNQASLLEHGVDTDVFKVVDTSALRDQMNIPQNAIVFLNANRNSRRKRLDNTISAFVQFCKRNPSLDAYLLLMTSKSGYYDIGSILYNEIIRHSFDCSKRVKSIQTDKHHFTDEMINKFYNLADYGINTSTGEGYGLTALEHLSVGKPQVLTKLPSYTFVDSNAVFVEPLPDREYYELDDYSGAYHDTFSTASIVDAMEEVLTKKTNFVPNTWKDVIGELKTALKLKIQIPELSNYEDNNNQCTPLGVLREEYQQVDLPVADVS